MKIAKNQKIIFLDFDLTLGITIEKSILMPNGYKKIRAFNFNSPTEYPVKAILSLNLDGDTNIIENGVNCAALQNINNDWFEIDKEFANDSAKIKVSLTDLGIATSYPYNVQIPFLVEK